jgi:hypothetical protein
MLRRLLLGGALLLLVAPAASARPASSCSGSLVWRGAGSYRLVVRCPATIDSVHVAPNPPLTLSAVRAHGCAKSRAGVYSCDNVRRLAAVVTTPQDQACALRLKLSGRGMKKLALVAAGCRAVLHFSVDYAGKAHGIESADVFSTWTSDLNWNAHWGDLALSLPAPSLAQSVSKTTTGTWQFNSDGCAGTVAELDPAPAQVYALANPVTGTYRLLVEAGLHLGNGGITSAGTSPLTCRLWDGGTIEARGTNAYPTGKRVSYTASLQALIEVKYSTLSAISPGHSFVGSLEGPDTSLKPTSFTGPIVQWTGQVVLTRTR